MFVGRNSSSWFETYMVQVRKGEVVCYYRFAHAITNHATPRFAHALPTVRATGGSANNLFIPTPSAKHIRIDEPHPSKRIGTSLLYTIRSIVFDKFGLEICKFEPAAGQLL